MTDQREVKRYRLPGFLPEPAANGFVEIVLASDFDALKAERDAIEEQGDYYKGILRLIANGWETPKSLAQAAIDYRFEEIDDDERY